jgi:hypothetical protein
MAEQATGRATPKQYPVLDASVLEMADAHRIVREDVKMNCVRYSFPAGFNKLPLFEECRALTKLDDFDVMYDVLMQMLENKDVRIELKDSNNRYQLLSEFHVTDRYQDLRGVDEIDEYPVLITWLTQFIATELLKKYPRPGSEVPPTKVAEKETKKGGRRAKA